LLRPDVGQTLLLSSPSVMMSDDLQYKLARPGNPMVRFAPHHRDCLQNKR